jgi:hypothetical protein
MSKIIMITLTGIIIGGCGGWVCWKNFGCRAGCLITSKPVNSTIYGALVGGLLFYTLFSFFSKNK